MPLQEHELLNRGFSFERADGTVVNQLLRFSVDRRIVGSSHPNETSWQIRDGKLVFLDRDGNVTTHFFQIARNDDALVIRGGYLPRDPQEAWHILREIKANPPSLRVAAVNPNQSGVDAPTGNDGTGMPLSFDDVVTKIFVYKDAFGLVLAPAVYLLPDGRIFGTRSPREDSWQLAGDHLLVTNATGDESTKFVFAETLENLVCLVADGIDPSGIDNRRFLVEAPRSSYGAPDAARRIREARQKPAVVLIRTHVMNDKVQSLIDSLERTATNYDVGLIVDETNGRPPVSHDRIVWHSVTECRQLGLASASTRPLWWCGDYPLYFAYEQLPEYNFYFMIEYDVHMTAGDGSLFSDVIDQLSSGTGNFDGIGIRFRREGFRTNDSLVTAAFAKFPEVHACFFPFVGLSRAAVGYLYAQRQIEALKQTPEDEIIYCESFVPTLLLKAGFKFGDLNEVIPGACDERLMIVPGRYPGLPVCLADGFQHHSRMIHPVYGNEEFLSRFLGRFDRRDWLEHFFQLLDDPGFFRLGPELREAYRQRAVAKLEKLGADLVAV